jgi:hypothetical protein
MEPSRKRLPFSCLFGWKFWRVLLLRVAGLATLIALFYAEENWRGKHAWEAYKREAERKGVVFDFARFVPPRVPDDQNFAMTPFFAPFFDFRPGTQQPRDTNAWKKRSEQVDVARQVYGTLEKNAWREGKSLDVVHLANELTAANRSAPPRFESGQTQGAAQAILDCLKPTEPVLGELRNAGRRPYSRFNIAYDSESKFSILLPHLAPLNYICSISELRASAELALGQTQKASEDVGLMFHVLGATRSEPFLITQVIRASEMTKLTQPIWEGIARHQWSDGQLEEFARELDALNFLDDGIRSLWAAQSFDNYFFTELRSNPSATSDLADLGSPVSSDSKLMDPGPPFWILIPRGWFYFEELNYCRLFADEVDDVMAHNRIDPAAADQRDAIETKLASENFLPAVWHHDALARLLMPAVSGFEYKMVRAQTYANLARVSCALERCRLTRGQYPESLDTLDPQFLRAVPHDVIMDQPLKYHLAGSGKFILYSVGWNKKDDGGTVAKHSLSRTEGDWVWNSLGTNSPEVKTP